MQVHLDNIALEYQAACLQSISTLQSAQAYRWHEGMMGILMLTESKQKSNSTKKELHKGTISTLHERSTKSALNMHMTEYADSRHPGPHTP